MLLEEQIKSLILTQYKSLRFFTQQIGVPYSTVDSMLKRGISGASISVVVRVCAALNICVDAVARGEIEHISSKTTASFTPLEIEHIEKYRILDQRGKAAVDSILEHEYQLASNFQTDILSDKRA